MADKKIIAVVGATGNQGGGLVRAILADSSSGFAVRALTRDPDSEKAQELAKLGAEVVQADLDSGPTLRAAFPLTSWMSISGRCFHKSHRQARRLSPMRGRSIQRVWQKCCAAKLRNWR